ASPACTTSPSPGDAETGRPPSTSKIIYGTALRRPPLPPLLQNRLLRRKHQIEDFLVTTQEPS
ncbi:hypothetical protein, partial [Streptomyces sp. NPDC050164]|uniref:hypothetical protein n=1 Tax=Streptomyces sp. NPDC050164 TaxID=3365605 RepID=UPI00379B603B